MVINEKIQYADPLLSLRIFQLRRRHNISNTWHFHKEAEIIIILEGWLEVHFEDHSRTLHAGDILLIGRYEMHRDRTSRDSGLRYMVLQFDLEPFFDQSTLPYLQYFTHAEHSFSRLNDHIQHDRLSRNQISTAIHCIYQEVATKSIGYEMAVSLHIKQILLILLRLDAGMAQQIRNNPDLLRLKPVLDFIDADPSHKLVVEDAARMVNMSYYYFVKFFRKTTGMTFTSYITFKKIKIAERLLLTGDLSIAEVGERIGMPNMAHFYKNFKKYNQLAPNEYRKKMQIWQ